MFVDHLPSSLDFTSLASLSDLQAFLGISCLPYYSTLAKKKMSFRSVTPITWPSSCDLHPSKEFYCFSFVKWFTSI